MRTMMIVRSDSSKKLNVPQIRLPKPLGKPTPDSRSFYKLRYAPDASGPCCLKRNVEMRRCGGRGGGRGGVGLA
jgi:hypothetical protein